MQGTYFFYRDNAVRERQSIGAYFVKDKKTGLNLLFCAEQSTYWKSISQEGELVGIVSIKKPDLSPLTLIDIHELGYLNYVSGVSQISSSDEQSIVFD